MLRRLTFIELPDAIPADGRADVWADLRGETLVDPGSFLVMNGLVLGDVSGLISGSREYSQVSLCKRGIECVCRDICMRAARKRGGHILARRRMPRLWRFGWCSRG